MNEGRRKRILLRRLNISLLGELGSSELYARQAQITKDVQLALKLSAFIQDENNHASNLIRMIGECGGRVSRLGGVTRVLFFILGFVTAHMGVRTILSFNRIMERSGIDLYSAMTKYLSPDQSRSRYLEEITLMIEEERRHQAWFRSSMDSIQGFVGGENAVKSE